MSLKRLNQLRQERGELVKGARDLTDLAEKEKRSLTEEENTRFNDLIDKATKKKAEIENEERLLELERESASSAADDEKNQRSDKPETAEERQMKIFRRALLGGDRVLNEEEKRALSFGQDDKGGFLAPVEQFVTMLIKAVDDLVFVRKNATVIPVTSGGSLGAPSLDTDPDDADWTSELSTGNEDDAMAFGKRSLHPHPLAKRIKISNKLMRTAAMQPDALVRQRLAYKFGITQEKAYLLGSGANQPLGVYVASNDGVPTSRDFSTGNTSTSITGDGLLEAKYGLKQQYHARARWNFHRDAVKQIAKLKEDGSSGQYIWQPGLQAGQPDRLLNMPLDMSEYAPNTFTTGQYVGILADWSHYWIADSLALTVQVLTELYAETNQIGYIGRLESDGMPVLAEAFARVKLG